VDTRDGPYHAPVPSDQSTRGGSDISNSLIVGTSIAAWSIGAVAYYLAAGRVLGPSDYGLVAALISVVVVVGTLFVALQWGVARIVAGSSAQERADSRAVYRRAMIGSTGAVAALAIAAASVTVIIDLTLMPVPVVPLLITYLALVGMVPLLLACGTLQGQHRYVGFAWSYGSSGVLRAPLLLPLLLLPFSKVDSAMLAVAVAILIGAAWATWLTRDDLRVTIPPSRARWRDFTGSLTPVMVGLTGIAVLMNIDVVAAKIALGGAEAGLFGAASVVAKALLVVPQAMTLVLLPRVAERQSRGERTGSLLAAGIAVMAGTGLVAMLLAVPLEGPIMRIAFGTAFEPAASLLVPFLGATTLLGALLILVNHHVARSDHRFVWAVGGLAVVQVILLGLFSTSAEAIIAIDAGVAAAGLVLHEVMYFSTDESMLRGARAQIAGVLNRARRTGGAP
jgi:O-antigen/teichoic acid export membrane protein